MVQSHIVAKQQHHISPVLLHGELISCVTVCLTFRGVSFMLESNRKSNVLLKWPPQTTGFNKTLLFLTPCQDPCMTRPKYESHHFLSQETSCCKAVILGPQLHVRPKFVAFNTFSWIYGWMEQLTEVWHERQGERRENRDVVFFLVCVFARGRLIF